MKLGLTRLVRSHAASTGILYLVPRLLPLALVLLFGLAHGVAGLGVVAFTLSLWQFLMIVSDYGVSQWVLTKVAVAKPEVVRALLGRTAVGSLCALMVWLLDATSLVTFPRFLMPGLMAALILSGGQYAFVWGLIGNHRKAPLLFAILEFVIPAILASLAPSAVSGMLVALLTKTVLGVVLTIFAMARMTWADQSVGLAPKAFGLHSSLWALTSFASGTGELALLQSLGSAGVLGTYRVFQTVASLGSVVGFGAIAPLMQQRGRAVTGVLRTMILLGLVSGVVVIGSFGVTLLSIPTPGGVSALWAVLAGSALGLSACLSSMAVVPVTVLARKYGAKFTLRVGIISAITYWGTIGVLFLTDAPLLAPFSVLLAGVVGLLGNLGLLKVKRDELAPVTSRVPPAGGESG